MNFGFDEEQELLRKTARDFLEEHAPMQAVREVMEGPQAYATALWKQLAELGWLGLCIPETHGGAALGLVELAIVVEELGRSLAPVPFVPTALASQALLQLGNEAQREAWLPKVAAGDAVLSLALAEASGSDDPGDVALRAERRGQGFVLDGEKCFVPDAEAADAIVIAARTSAAEEGVGLFLVPRDAQGLEVESLRTIDRLRPLHRLRLRGVELPAEALLGGDAKAAGPLRRVLDRALVILAAEMLGGAAKCMEDSVQYAKERVQFGKPIGVNQAIKHKCADMLFEVESARSIVYYAAWAADQAPEEAAVAAAMAKAYVSDAYRKVAAENIQIHGGVGFTWEYDCHLYFKRAKSDETWLGDASYHRERVATLLEI